MCGIIGGKYDVLKHNFDTYLNRLKHRGTDSYGVTVFTPTYSTWFKATSLKKIKGKTLWEDVTSVKNTQHLLIHNRKASVGGINIDLAHPIEKGGWAVTHNGTKKSLQKLLEATCKSDTEAISTILGYTNVVKLLSELFDGAGVVLATNDPQFFVHIDGNRPLMMNKERTIFSSEPVESGEWALIKEQTKIYKSIEDFMQNCETYDFVEIEDIKKYKPYYCYKCKKTHLNTAYGLCPACESKYGKDTYTKQTTVTTTITKQSDLRKGMVVWCGLNYCWGVVTDIEKGGVKCVDAYGIEFNSIASQLIPAEAQDLEDCEVSVIYNKFIYNATIKKGIAVIKENLMEIHTQRANILVADWTKLWEIFPQEDLIEDAYYGV